MDMFIIQMVFVAAFLCYLNADIRLEADIQVAFLNMLHAPYLQ